MTDDNLDKELEDILHTPESPAEQAEDKALFRSDVRFMLFALFIAGIGMALYLLS